MNKGCVEPGNKKDSQKILGGNKASAKILPKGNTLKEYKQPE